LLNAADINNYKNLIWLFNAYRTDFSGGDKELCAFSKSGKATYHAADTFGRIIFG
jgi:hypothetical protein